MYMHLNVVQDLGFSPDFDLYEVLGPSMRTYRRRVRFKIPVIDLRGETLIART